jgi:hypothetical protein
MRFAPPRSKRQITAQHPASNNISGKVQPSLTELCKSSLKNELASTPLTKMLPKMFIADSAQNAITAE